jgi:hypothetical protein
LRGLSCWYAEMEAFTVKNNDMFRDGVDHYRGMKYLNLQRMM